MKRSISDQISTALPTFAVSIFFAVYLFSAEKALAGMSCHDVFTNSREGRVSGVYTSFARERNRELFEVLAKSPNYLLVSEKLQKTFQQEVVLESFTSPDQSRIEIIDRGLGRPTDLVRSDHAGKKILFSTFNLKRNNSITLTSFRRSPNKKLLALTLSQNGSTDFFRGLILNLETGKIVRDDIESSSSIVWLDSERVAFRSRPLAGSDRKALSTKAVPSETFNVIGSSVTSHNGGWVELVSDNKTELFHPLRKERYIVDTDFPVDEIAGTTIDGLITLNSKNPLGEIRLLRTNARSTKETELIYAEKHGVLTRIDLNDGWIIAHRRWGPNRDLLVMNQKGEVLSNFKIPDCCSVRKIQWLKQGESLQITLSSAIMSNVPLTYDIKNKTWNISDLERKMLTRDGVEYVSEIRYFKAKDSSLSIPMRLTRRKDVVPDGTNPVFMQVYGGFGSSGYLDPQRLDVMESDFVLRGGIIAGPAIRGGNEYGRVSHEEGRLKFKQNTLNDLIEAANYLSAQGWTKPERIITYGASNGGFVVAAAALQSPSVFGLVIPVAGVHDLLSKESLDKDFNSGWVQEYGDSRGQAISWLQAMSPVRLAPNQRPPKMLIIHGMDDSRVHAEHSKRLIEALSEEAKRSSRVLSFHPRNAGHWLRSFDYQNIIAWRTLAIQWSVIYDHLGWRMDEPPPAP